jgi:site-specific DNA-methyltransferase (adenine-specific)
MTPRSDECLYYGEDGAWLYHDDNRSRLEKLREDGVMVDCTVTSAPYGSVLSRLPKDGKFTGMLKESGWMRKMADNRYEDEMDEGEYRENERQLAALVLDVSAPGASFFYNHKLRFRDQEVLHPLDIVRSFDGWEMKQEIIWNRGVAVAFNARIFAPSDERIYWLVKPGGRHKWNQEAAGWMTVWNMRPMNAGGGDHPCPFPIELAQKCIAATTSPGDLVLDYYLGSGTTMRAAKDLGRQSIGIESESRFCRIAVDRLAQEVLF